MTLWVGDNQSLLCAYHHGSTVVSLWPTHITPIRKAFALQWASLFLLLFEELLMQKRMLNSLAVHIQAVFETQWLCMRCVFIVGVRGKADQTV